jgi:hypothetical protein
MEILLAVYVFVMIMCVMMLFRLNRFSKFIRAEIDRVGAARISGDRTVVYPDIMASYDNLKWYDVFNYKFDRLVVYDKF